jgi:hypothetical protein
VCDNVVTGISESGKVSNEKANPFPRFRISPVMRNARLPLASCVALAVLSIQSHAQQSEPEQCIDLGAETPPGLYVTVDQSQVYLTKEGKVVELSPGESAYANETQLTCLNITPAILDWPCGTIEDRARAKAEEYTVDDLPAIGSIQEIKRRYFEDKRVLGPPIEWLNGEIHGTFPLSEFEGLDTSKSWYQRATEDPFASDKRPKAQLIGMFGATKQMIVDGNTFEAMKREHPDGEIPVVFMFFEQQHVPISFFGPDPSLKAILDAYFERGIEVVPAPVWYAGEYTLMVDLNEIQEMFDLRPVAELNPEDVALMKADIERDGFRTKPFTVSAMGESGSIFLDQPAKMSVAVSMGITSFPVVVQHFGPTSHLAACDIPRPEVSAVGDAQSIDELPDDIDEVPDPPPPVILPPPEDDRSDG